MGPRPQLFLGDVLLTAQAFSGKSAEELAQELPVSLLEAPPDAPIAGATLHVDQVEEAVGLCARIIRDRLFGDYSRLVGFECMRALLEDDFPWPRPGELTNEIDRAIKAFEAREITEARLLDWVHSWIAHAERQRERAGRRRYGLGGTCGSPRP